MKCPHCLVDIHPSLKRFELGSDKYNQWIIYKHICSACDNSFYFLQKLSLSGISLDIMLVYPKGTNRPPCPAEVPDKIREDYNEACLVLSDSPKASSALSRRCLQMILREYAGVKSSDLYHEIEDYCSKPDIPSYISEVVDAVRNIGNFAAHPIKSTRSGEIIEVEPGEAEWNLEVLEALFDFHFVQLKRIAEKKAKHNNIIL